jgi:hypothetical protein
MYTTKEQSKNDVSANHCLKILCDIIVGSLNF